MPISDYAICIDRNITITSLPAGTVRVGVSGEPAKIIIGKAPVMGTPFCNGISGLPFIALPANPNFSGRFVIIGRNGSVPTYWGCADTAALIVQCTVLNNGDGIGFDDPGFEIANCKLFLDNNGYALSDSNAEVFLESYFA